MMDCKNALVKAEGDFAKAEKHLKELGLAAAAKRSDRATNEGRIFPLVRRDAAAVLELSCETDFVARNADFIRIGSEMVEYVVDKNPAGDDPFLEGKVKEVISKIKENITLKRFKRLTVSDSEIIIDYMHGEGKIGVLVKLGTEDKTKVEDPAVRELAFDLALHVAAFNPAYLSRDKVDPAYLKEQEEIFTVQAKNLGKPDNVTAGIVKGKISKHLGEICFIDQGFVKDEKKTVSQVLAEKGKEVGTKLSIVDFVYFKVGEAQD